MEPLVSLVVPIYNMEKRIKDCINSIVQQTHKNLEVFLVNDGSHDRSEEICKEMTQLDKRFHYLEQENSGVSVARNNGLKQCKGEWVAFVDPDDSLIPEFIHSLLEECNEAVDIICCDYYAVEGKNSKTEHFFRRSMRFSGDDVNKKDLFLELLDPQYMSEEFRSTAIGVPWGKLYRRSFLEKEGLFFDVKLIRMQDNVFNMDAFSKAKSVYYIHEPYYNYTCEHISGFGNKYDPQALNYFNEVILRHRLFIDHSPLCGDEEIENYFNKEVFNLFFSMVLMSYAHNRNEQGVGTQVKKIKKRLEEKVYYHAIHNLQLKDIKGVGNKVTLFLMKKKWIRILVYIVRIYKRESHT